MATRADLHTHTTASDGALAPSDLVARAAAAGVSCLAVTDHDTVAGLAEAEAAAARLGVAWVPGVEVSATWRGRTLHVVGLGVDRNDPGLAAGLERLQGVRHQRGERIGRRLEAHGIADARSGVAALTGEAAPTRGHYSRWLVSAGYARDEASAFRRFLARGRPGYAGAEWAGLAEAVGWIRGAGGVAVLAHPHAYGLTATKLREAATAFRDAGGEAVEVVTAAHRQPSEIAAAAGLARRLGLAASVGSDCHDPDGPGPRLGPLPALPEDLTAVWELL